MTAQEASQLRQSIDALRRALDAERSERLAYHERAEKLRAEQAREIAALWAELARVADDVGNLNTDRMDGDVSRRRAA